MRNSAPRTKKPLEQPRYGRLTILENAHGGWLCRCDCGTTLTVKGPRLRSGAVVSCGCYHRERQVEVGTIHGMKGTPTYSTWVNMRQRCNNANNPDYVNYGGRGISVCERWQDFSAFLADMGVRPDGMSIERIDNHGNYVPGNCRWATKVEQSVNKRTNIPITRDGRTQTLKEWCAELGINYWTAHSRIRRGAKPSEAIGV
jgi:hypothetical protein